MYSNPDRIAKMYELAKETFAAYGVCTEKAMAEFVNIPISLHCWQGDDIKGFEDLGDVESQNTVIGSYPGAARNAAELRADICQAFSYSPAKHRVNLHSCYAEAVDGHARDTYTYEDFADYVTEEQFVEWNGAYLKIAVEKGYFTFDYILELIEMYKGWMP